MLNPPDLDIKHQTYTCIFHSRLASLCFLSHQMCLISSWDIEFSPRGKAEYMLSQPTLEIKNQTYYIINLCSRYVPLYFLSIRLCFVPSRSIKFLLWRELKTCSVYPHIGSLQTNPLYYFFLQLCFIPLMLCFISSWHFEFFWVGSPRHAQSSQLKHLKPNLYNYFVFLFCYFLIFNTLFLLCPFQCF